MQVTIEFYKTSLSALWQKDISDIYLFKGLTQLVISRSTLLAFLCMSKEHNIQFKTNYIIKKKSGQY